jgi:WD40 repeat protein
MPQNPNIITTKAVSGDLHIYDINLSYKNNELTKPERKLTGHSKEGFAVNWSGLKEGWIASGADDGKVLIWGGLDSTEYLVSPVLEYRHEGSVHDVCWNRVNENLLASVGSGGNICQ